MIYKKVLESMGIRKPAVTGILESGDRQVTVEPGEGNIELTLKNVVINQYGNQIERMVMETLENLGMKDVGIAVVDKDILDCTIRARVEDAVFRAAGQYGNLPWGGAVR